MSYTKRYAEMYGRKSKPTLEVFKNVAEIHKYKTQTEYCWGFMFVCFICILLGYLVNIEGLLVTAFMLFILGMTLSLGLYNSMGNATIKARIYYHTLSRQQLSETIMHYKAVTYSSMVRLPKTFHDEIKHMENVYEGN